MRFSTLHALTNMHLPATERTELAAGDAVHALATRLGSTRHKDMDDLVLSSLVERTKHESDETHLGIFEFLVATMSLRDENKLTVTSTKRKERSTCHTSEDDVGRRTNSSLSRSCPKFTVRSPMKNRIACHSQCRRCSKKERKWSRIFRQVLPQCLVRCALFHKFSFGNKQTWTKHHFNGRLLTS